MASALFASVSFFSAGALRAANTEDDVLSGLAANSDLSAASSYSTTAPSTGGVPTTTSDVTFTAAGTYTSPYKFGSSLSIGSLDDLSTTALTLQGNADTLTLNGGDSISGNTADLLYVASGASLALSNTGTLGIALGASGNFDVVGTASVAGVVSGAFALTKTGAGTLTFSNNETYSGGTTISGGTLTLAAGGGAGGVRGAVTINSGATLLLTVNNALGYSAGSQITTLNINGGTVTTDAAHTDEGYLTSFNLTGGTLAYTGTNNTNAYQIAAGDATAPNITSNASTNLSLVSGFVNIRSGNLPINVAKGTTTGGVDLQISGQVNSSGTFGVTKNGAGNLLLSNFNGYTGGTTVSGGTLTLAAGGATGTVLNAISLASGTTLALSTTDDLGYNAGGVVTTITANGATVSNTSGGNEGFLTSYNLTGSTISSTAPTTGTNAGTVGTYVFNTTSTTPPTITSNASATTSTISAPLLLQNAGSFGISVAQGTTASGYDLTISGVIGSFNGNSGITKTGAGTLNLTGANTFTGNIAVNAGTVNLGSVGADNNSTSPAGATSGKTITVASGATLTASVNNVFGRGATGSTLPTITLNGGTFSTNRYNVLGPLNLNGGTVTTNDTADTGNYQTLQLRGNVTVGGTAASVFNASNVSATTGGIHLDTNSLFTVASTGATGADLTVNAPFRNRSGDYQNTAGGLTKAGAGTMLLTAASTYTGPTAVNAGTLLISGSINGSTAVSVAAGGALTLSNTAATVLADSGTLTLTSASGMTTALNLNAAAGTSEVIGSLVLDGTTEMPGTYTAAQLTTLDSAITFSSLNGETLTVVPEPSTWVGMVVLVGLVGVTQRRRFTAGV